VAYDVHVTRAADWADSGRMPIRVGDLREIAERESLRIIPTGVMNDHDLYVMCDGRAESLGVWSNGAVMVRDPHPWHLARTVLLAARLHAYAIGTDEVRYRLADGELRRSGVGLDESLGRVKALLATGPDTGWPTPPWADAAAEPASLRPSLWRRMFRRG